MNLYRSAVALAHVLTLIAIILAFHQSRKTQRDILLNRGIAEDLQTKIDALWGSRLNDANNSSPLPAK